MHALKGLRAKQHSDGRGQLIAAGDDWAVQPVMGYCGPVLACLTHASLRMSSQHAGIGMGCSAPMDSDVFVRVFEPMPGQDFLGPTADELRVFARRCLALDGGGHDCKSSPKVAAIRTRCPKCRHCCV